MYNLPAFHLPRTAEEFEIAAGVRTALAALVAFYAGTQMQVEQPADIPEIASEQSSVYVPHNGIVAAVSESNNATEIILNGLAPISDELDIAAGDTSPGRSPMMANTQEEVNPYTFF